MKKITFLALIAVSLSAFVFTGCNDDDDDHDHDHEHNEIVINFLEPTDEEVITDASDVHIHIEFVASDENHEVEVVLYPEDDADDKIIDFDEHTHDALVVFEQDVDLSDYASGTEFHLEVVACKDHDCEETVTDDIHFSIQ